MSRVVVVIFLLYFKWRLSLTLPFFYSALTLVSLTCISFFFALEQSLLNLSVWVSHAARSRHTQNHLLPRLIKVRKWREKRSFTLQEWKNEWMTSCLGVSKVKSIPTLWHAPTTERRRAAPWQQHNTITQWKKKRGMRKGAASGLKLDVWIRRNKLWKLTEQRRRKVHREKSRSCRAGPWRRSASEGRAELPMRWSVAWARAKRPLRARADRVGRRR